MRHLIRALGGVPTPDEALRLWPIIRFVNDILDSLGSHGN